MRIYLKEQNLFGGEMKKQNIKNTIIINMVWILIAFIVVLCWQYKIITDNELIYKTKLQQQQTNHLEKLAEFTENYNELHDDYNTLYLDYRILAAEKGFYDGWELYKCTGYTSLDAGCNNISASGIDILKWSKYFNFCAVPPEYELGTVFLVKFGNSIEPFLAVDRGGAIQIEDDGMVHIDLYFINDLTSAFNFGVKELEVKVIN